MLHTGNETATKKQTHPCYTKLHLTDITLLPNISTPNYSKKSPMANTVPLYLSIYQLTMY